MTSFPHTDRTFLTEKIMSLVMKRLPDIQTHEYNRIFEAVYEGLEDAEGVQDNTGDAG